MVENAYQDVIFGNVLPANWYLKKLKEILVEGRLGGNYENAESNTGIPVIKMGNLDRGKIKIDKVQYLSENETYNKEDLLLEGDLLFNTRNTLDLVGKVAIWRNELPLAVYNSNLMRMKFDSSYVYSNCFMNCVFNSNYGLRQLRAIATGTTSVAAIYDRDLQSIKIPLPPLPEQRAIARLLSTWDEAISKHEKLIKACEQRKKWLMQSLLTGKRRLRSASGKKFEGGWKKIQLEEIGIFFKGAGIAKIEVREMGLPAIRYGELYTKHHFLIVEITTFIDRQSAELSKEVRKGDILFAGSGETNEEIGKCATYTKDDVAYAGSDIIVFRPQNTNSNFLGYLLNSAPVNSQKSRMGKGHSVVHIYPSDIANITLSIPDLIEQTAIAQMLQAADKEISLLKTKVEKLREQKKGLMQVLLTGKVRLKI